jgi:hypothetical protein
MAHSPDHAGIETLVLGAELGGTSLIATRLARRVLLTPEEK